MSGFNRLIAYAPALVLGSPALAQESTAGAWATINAGIPVAPRIEGTLELQRRFGVAAEAMDQLLLRPSINYKFDNGITAAAVYAFVRTNLPDERRIDEHRSWQQISLPLVEGPRLRLTSRTRLEQRFVAQRPGTGWRLRHQLRLAAPLAKVRGVEAVVWNEHFFGLNQTGWGQRRGVERLRTFVGATVPLSSKVRLESGYLNQALFRRGADRMDHVISTSLSARL